jgi:putative hydrolase of the HAD superfamily
MRAIFFDLDNTLYDTSKYYHRAFESISKSLSKKTKQNKNLIYHKLCVRWIEKTSMYPNLFDDVLSKLGIEDNIQEIVEIFNNQSIKKEDYYSDASTILKKLKNQYKLGIITDGNITRQKNKIEKFDMNEIIDLVVYTKKIAPKPSPLPFEYAINELEIEPSESYYIADNPKIDFFGAKKVGMNTVRILRGEYAKIPSDGYVDNTINEMKELLDIIN